MTELISQKEEWKEGELVLSTKKAIRLSIAQGMYRLAENCGHPLNDSGLDELMSFLEKFRKSGA